MSSLSPVDASLSGFTLAFKRPMLILAWAGLYVLAVVAIGLLAFLLAGPSLMSIAAMGDNPDPAAVMGAMSGLWLLLILLFPLLLVISAMFLGAVFRAVLRPNEKKFAYVALGADEGRLIVVSIVFFLLGLVVFGGLAGVIFGATMAVGENLKGIVAFVLIVAAICLGVWLSVRMSLASAQTFAERRINIFGTWSLTSGRFWPMFGMWVLVVIFAIITSIAVALLSYIPLLVAGGLGGVAQVSNPDPSTMSVGIIIGMVFYGLIQLIGSILQSVVMYAPAAAAYRQLVPDNSGAAEVFA